MMHPLEGRGAGAGSRLRDFEGGRLPGTVARQTRNILRRAVEVPGEVGER